MRRRLSPTAPFRPLRRATKVPVWADAGLRLGAALALIFFVVLVHWLDREGLKDNHDNVVSLLDVFYFTMISITTTAGAQRLEAGDAIVEIQPTCVSEVG